GRGIAVTSWPARALATIAVIFTLREADTILVPFVIAIVLTFVLAVPVRKLRAFGVPEVVGAGAMVSALVLGAAILATLLVGPATEWAARAPSAISQLVLKVDRVRQAVPFLAPPAVAAANPSASGAGASTRRSLRSTPSPAPAAVAPNPDDPVRDSIASAGVTFTGLVVGHAFRLAASTGATIILLFFLLASEHWLLFRTIEAVPRHRTRALLLSAVRRAQREIAHLLGVQTLVNVVLGTATGLAVSALGLPSPVLWGTLAGLLNYIPYLGPLCTAAVLLLAGVVTFDDVGSMLAPAGAFVGLHIVESNLVTPMFIGHRLSLSPIAVFLSVMFWGWLWGIPGAMVAVPLLIGIRSACKRVRGWRLACVYIESARGAPSLRSLLRARQTRSPPSARSRAAAKPTRSPAAVASTDGPADAPLRPEKAPRAAAS
ncbi:MAG TPA: AI-2E family transporter, partial [Burkholderiaceae bacterium]|nr:AI-2E family transporter [Burkholderiaceae bacterium]